MAADPSSGPAAFKRLEASPRAGRLPAIVWIAPYCDPPEQAASAENAWLIPFAGLRGSRTQSTSGCRALAARMDDPVLTAWFSPSWSRRCLGVCNPGCLQPLGVCNPYLPQEWAKDRWRRAEAGVPRSVEFRTRHQLALEMLEECGGVLPHTWIAGDDEMGRPSGFRLELRHLRKRYLLAVPSNTLIRDLEAPPPEYSGRGPRPRSPFIRVDAWCKKQPEDGWITIDVRDGEKGPLVIEAVKRRVQARTEKGGTGPDEVLFVTRERQADNTHKVDYYLSNAAASVPLEEFAWVAKAAHRVEECVQRAKGEAGLADYQVRNWIGWHHHQALSLLAAWFLNKETRRGKNTDSRADESATAAVDRRTDRFTPQDERARISLSSEHALVTAQRTSTLLPLSFT